MRDSDMRVDTGRTGHVLISAFVIRDEKHANVHSPALLVDRELPIVLARSPDPPGAEAELADHVPRPQEGMRHVRWSLGAPAWLPHVAARQGGLATTPLRSLQAARRCRQGQEPGHQRGEAHGGRREGRRKACPLQR